jgi:hypothetical protein
VHVVQMRSSQLTGDQAAAAAPATHQQNVVCAGSTHAAPHTQVWTTPSRNTNCELATIKMVFKNPQAAAINREAILISYKLAYKEVALMPDIWTQPAGHCVVPSVYGKRQMRAKRFDSNKMLAVCVKGAWQLDAGSREHALHACRVAAQHKVIADMDQGRPLVASALCTTHNHQPGPPCTLTHTGVRHPMPYVPSPTTHNINAPFEHTIHAHHPQQRAHLASSRQSAFYRSALHGSTLHGSLPKHCSLLVWSWQPHHEVQPLAKCSVCLHILHALHAMLPDCHVAASHHSTSAWAIPCCKQTQLLTNMQHFSMTHKRKPVTRAINLHSPGRANTGRPMPRSLSHTHQTRQ